MFAIAEALREEYLEIYNAGFVLQVDDAVLANMYDELMQESPKHYRDWAELRVEALNHALRGIPEDRIRYHICFGSWHVPHVADAPLEAIVDLMLTVRAGAYSIEAGNVRHEHEWRVWEKGQTAAGQDPDPGRDYAPHDDSGTSAAGGRPDRSVSPSSSAARTSSPVPTAASPRSEGVQRVHPQVMWAKLEALAEGARIASRELWGRKTA